MNNITIYFDGGCSGNGTKTATGKWCFVLEDTDSNRDYFNGEVEADLVTNNVAEYKGIIQALRHILFLQKNDIVFDSIKILGDSNLIINMVSGRWGRKKPHKKAPHLLSLLVEAKTLVSLIESDLSFTWIPRDLNIADELANTNLSTV